MICYAVVAGNGVEILLWENHVDRRQARSDELIALWGTLIILYESIFYQWFIWNIGAIIFTTIISKHLVAHIYGKRRIKRHPELVETIPFGIAFQGLEIFEFNFLPGEKQGWIEPSLGLVFFNFGNAPDQHERAFQLLVWRGRRFIVQRQRQRAGERQQCGQ